MFHEGINALIVDGNDLVGLQFALRLKKEGLCVSLARTGAEGIALVSRRPPKVVFLDVNLPDMKTTEAALVMRRYLDEDALIVAVTDKDKQAHGSLTGAGIDRLLKRPVSEMHLKRSIKGFNRRFWQYGMSTLPH